MAKRLTTIELSRISGVSRGTVDRVLHNRGHVSEDLRMKVEKALAENSYKFNLHTSAISYCKTCRISVCIPASAKGDYWNSVSLGIQGAVEEYSDLNIDLNFINFDSFDGKSFLKSATAAVMAGTDGMILSPLFQEESIAICHMLDDRSIPYTFVDAEQSGTNPISTYTIDQEASGHMAGFIIDAITPKDKAIALFYGSRSGKTVGTNARKRIDGCASYFKENNNPRIMHELDMQIQDNAAIEERIADHLLDNPDTGGIAVLNGWGGVVVDALRKIGRNDIKIIAYDLTTDNIRALKEGRISAVICQRPETQGFMATEDLLEHIVFRGGSSNALHLLPIEIILKDNLPYYESFHTNHRHLPTGSLNVQGDFLRKNNG